MSAQGQEQQHDMDATPAAESSNNQHQASRNSRWSSHHDGIQRSSSRSRKRVRRV